MPAQIPRSVAEKTSEDGHQEYVVSWLRSRGALFHAAANGSHRSSKAGSKAKCMGMECGVPDLMVHGGRHGFCGLAIEMKNPQGTGRVSPEQQAYHKRLADEANYLVGVCHGAQPAIALLQWWFYAPEDPEDAKYHLNAGADSDESMPSPAAQQ